MLLWGRYIEQNGIWNNCRNDRDDSLREDMPIITDLFYKAGYKTSYFGKCHWTKNEPFFDRKGNYDGTTEAPGGHYMNKYDTYIPSGKARHSIEYFYQSVRDVHFDPRIYSCDTAAVGDKKDGELHRPKIFSPKNEAEKIIAYLKNDNDIRSKDKPFFMMWSINPPHNPWKDANTDMNTLKKFYGTDRIPEIDSLIVRENAEVAIASYAHHYFANVSSVDKYIGQVLKVLEELGKLKNTIVLLSSDHGEMMGSHCLTGKNIFEPESLAVPFIVHWPKKNKRRENYRCSF